MARLRQLNSPFLYYFPVLLFLFNFLSKFIFVSHEDIGLDEPFSIYHAQFDIPILIEQLKNYNNPPLFELILHGWIKILGISPLSVRILPLLFASLAPVALYHLAKHTFSTETAITSSLLLSVSELLFYYSHDCRVYSLSLLLSILSIHFYLKTISSDRPSIQVQAGFILFSTLLIYAHYFGIFILFFQLVISLLFHRTKWPRLLACYFSISLLYLPHLFPLLVRMNDSVSRGTWISPPVGLESLYNMLWAFCNFPFITVTAIVILTGAFFLMLRRRDFMKRDANVSLVLLWFLFPFFGMFIISYKVPMYISRYLIFALPAFYLTFVIAIQYIVAHKHIRYLTFIVLIVCFGTTIDFTNDKKERMGEVVKLINAKKDPATAVILSDNDLLTTFAYHYRNDYFSAVGDNREYQLMQHLLRTDNVYTQGVLPDLRVLAQSKYSKIIYYAIAGHAKAENPALLYFNEHYRMADTKKTKAGSMLYFFEKPD